MPRNAAGNYTLPLPPVVSGTTIAANVENTTDSDIASELTNSLDRNGRGGMLAPFKIFDGTVSAPGMAFTLDPDNGIYRIGNDDWGMAVAGTLAAELNAGGLTVWQGLAVHGIANFAGNLTLTGNLDTTGYIGISGSTGLIGQAADGQAKLVLASASVNDAAFIAFNHTGSFGGYFGLDADNVWKVGGWSYGALSYALLHEGNSFTLSGPAGNPTTLITTRAVWVGGLTCTDPDFGLGAVTCRDVHAHRNTNAGVIFMGTTGDAYISQTGTPLFVFSKGICGVEGLSCGKTDASGAPYPTIFSARTAPDKNINMYAGSSGPVIGAHNDALSLYQNLLFGNVPMVATDADNTTLLGYPTQRWAAVYAVNGVIQTSDARQKTNIAPSALGLSFIEGLNPVSFQRIVEKNVVTRVPDYEEPVPEQMDVHGNIIPATTRTVYKDLVTPIPGTRTHWGLIAQDVKNAVTAAGVDFAGLYEDADPAVGMGLTYTEFIAPLIKAVQELSAKVAALEAA